MSAKEKNWLKIFSDSSINILLREWINDISSVPTFEIPNNIFKELKLKPVRMIPHYHRKELPKILMDNKLEIIRNKSGTCLLVKRDKLKYSLFPDLVIISKISIEKQPPLIQKSILFRDEIMNEDNYFYLSQRMKVLQTYLVDQLKLKNCENLEHCGRFQGNVSSEISLGDKNIDLDRTNFEIDHILENAKYLVIIELKKKFYNTQSTHQLLFPYLKYTEDPREKILIYFETNAEQGLRFRLYQLIINTENSILKFDHSYFDNGVEYIVKRS